MKTTSFYLLKYAEFASKDLASALSSLDSLIQDVRKIKLQMDATPPTPACLDAAGSKARTWNCNSTLVPQSQPHPFVRVSETQSELTSNPGWYYYGNAPPIDAVAFWDIRI